MSNLGQLATTVGQILGVSTSDGTLRPGAAVRASLTSWHDSLYQSYLWKDSVIDMEIPVNQAYTPTSNYMPTKGHVILPPIFQLVLGTKFGRRTMQVERATMHLRANHDGYGCTGQNGSVCFPRSFDILPAAVWEFDTVQAALYMVASNAADQNQVITVDEVASDEVTVTRSQVAASILGTQLANTDRLDNVLKGQTQGTIAFGYQTGTQLGANIIPANSFSVAFGPIGQFVVTGWIPNSPYTVTFGFNELSLNIQGQSAIPNPGQGQTVNITTPAAGQSIIFTYQHPAQTVIALFQPIVAASTPIITMQPGDTAAPKSQRIKLWQKPNSTLAQSVNLFVLGKRTTPPFSADSDVPGVYGFDRILIALAYYDFKKRDEAGGSADALASLSEAVGPTFLTTGKPGGLLAKLIEQETLQAAYQSRIIPDTGFGGTRLRDDCWGGDKCDPYDFC